MEGRPLACRYAEASDQTMISQSLASLAEEIETFYFEIGESKINSGISHQQIMVAFSLDDPEQVPIGFLWFEISLKTPFGCNYGQWFHPILYISYIYVEKEWRNRGVGTFLYQTVENMIRFENREVKEVFILSRFNDPKLSSLYQKMGFEPSLNILSKKIKPNTIEEISKFQVRLAEERDFDFIYNGQVDIWTVEEKIEFIDHKEEREITLKGIKNKQITLILSEANEPIGFSWIEVSSTVPYGVDYGNWPYPYVFVDFIFTSKEWRGKGVASTLYQIAEKTYADLGFREILLDIFCVNKPSLAYHARMGYHSIITLYTKLLTESTQ